MKDLALVGLFSKREGGNELNQDISFKMIHWMAFKGPAYMGKFQELRVKERK